MRRMSSVRDGEVNANFTASVPNSDRSAARLQPGSYDLGPARELLARHHQLQYPYICQFGSAVLEIGEGVFCPTLTKVSPLLLNAITFRREGRVLDVFSGSGAFGINAALQGADVVTVDISEAAVACTVRNALLNNVAARVDARKGVIQECVSANETFDLIIANPPLLPGCRSDELSAAVFDPGLRATIDFILAVKRHLNPHGCCYLVTSDIIDRYGYDIDRIVVEGGLVSAIADKLDVGYETYRVHELYRNDELL
jgi:methylase of polypeptide subunit release factors